MIVNDNSRKRKKIPAWLLGATGGAGPVREQYRRVPYELAGQGGAGPVPRVYSGSNPNMRGEVVTPKAYTPSPITLNNAKDFVTGMPEGAAEIARLLKRKRNLSSWMPGKG